MVYSKCLNHFKIVFDHLSLSFFKRIMRYFLCTSYVKYQHASLALMHMFFGNDQGVHLLEHVC